MTVIASSAGMTPPGKILLVSGSTRSGSTNTAALRTLSALAAPAMAVLYEGMADLPAFNPDDDHEPLPPVVAGLRQHVTAAEAVVFCTPEYAGELPGSFKNLLDWTVGGGEMYGKPVAWINVAAEGRGDGAQSSLARVLGYVGAVVIQPACRRITVARSAVGPDGLVTDPRFAAEAAQVLRAIAGYLSSD